MLKVNDRAKMDLYKKIRIESKEEVRKMALDSNLKKILYHGS